jgi:hypothetical protein
VPFWPTLAAFLLGAAAVPARQVVRGEPLTNLLGAYGGITKLGYDWGAAWDYLLYHLADLDILTGVIPFAAFVAFAIWSLRPSQGRNLRVFSALGVSLTAWFVVVAAAYGSTPVATRIVERNMFHVVPVFFLALAGWIAHGCPRPWWAVAPATILAGTITLTLPVNSFLTGTVVHSTPALMPIWRWRDRFFSAESIDEVVFAAAVLAAAAFLLVPRRAAPLLLVVLMAYFFAGSRPVEGMTRGASLSSYRFGVGDAAPDWIDQAADGDVLSFWWAGANAVPYWESEFFNRRIKRTYSLLGPYDGLTHTFTYPTVRPSGLIVADGKPIDAPFVMTDRGTRLRGTIVARNPTPDLVLYRLSGPLAVDERVDGRYGDDWAGSSFGYRRFDCRGGRVRLAIENNPLVHPEPFEAQVTRNGVPFTTMRFTPGTRRSTATIPLRPVDGECSVGFTMPTAPGTPVNAGDQRQLGLRFTDVRYVPPR